MSSMKEISDLLIKIAYADKGDRLMLFNELKNAIDKNVFSNTNLTLEESNTQNEILMQIYNELYEEVKTSRTTSRSVIRLISRSIIIIMSRSIH